MALSTVSLCLKRIGMGKLSRLEPLEPPNRYERHRPGELVHVDVKKLGRISSMAAVHRIGRKHYKPRPTAIAHRDGWEFVHVMIDDHARLAYAEVFPDDSAARTAIAFLRRAHGFL